MTAKDAPDERDDRIAELGRRIETLEETVRAMIRELAVERERQAHLCGLLGECANDLEAYIKHHYDGTLHYPSLLKKFESEMSLVEEARAAIRRGGQSDQRGQ